MPNWIEEARVEAQRQLPIKELEEAKQISQRKLETERSKREETVLREKQHRLFHEAVFQTKKEIEAVLSEARENGLLVEGPQEGYCSATEFGDYLRRSDITGDGGDGFVTDHEVWGYYWVVSIPNNRKSLTIYLGAFEKKMQVFGITFLRQLRPGNTATNVELKIKSWLVEIFSERK